MSGGYKRRVLRPDSPALRNYEPTATGELTTAQRRLVKQLRDGNGVLRLDVCHAMTVAGLVRRGLVTIDETTVRLVQP